MPTLPPLVARIATVSLSGACVVFSLAAGKPNMPVKVKAAPVAGDVTFNKDIAPILFNHCVSCHRPGQGAPFPLLTYKDAQKRGALIAEVTQSRQMPPWKPAPADCAFQDDIHLSDTQIQTLQQWAKDGMKEGKASDLPAAPTFADEWALGKPDLIVKMPQAYTVPADGPDIYRNFVLPLNLPKDTYIRAVDFRPSARSVVHHSLFFYDATGDARKRDGEDGKPGFGGAMGGLLGGSGSLQRFRAAGQGGVPSFGTLGGWAVGAQPVGMPEGLSYTVPQAGDLILSTHFHPSGKMEKEQSVVGLYFAKEAPKQQMMMLQLPPVFGALSGLDIPAGAKDYVIEDTFTLPVDVRAFGVTAHAHYLGKSMKLTATLPDGTVKTLLWIPDWDFNWQGQYMYKDFIALPKGTVLHGIVHFDNSAENPRQPSNPPKQVKWGEQSTDEMGSVILRLVATNESDMPQLQKEYRSHLRDAFMKHPFRPRQATQGRRLGARLGQN